MTTADGHATARLGFACLLVAAIAACSKSEDRAVPAGGDAPLPTPVPPTGSTEKLGAVSLPDLASCHRECLKQDGQTSETCRKRCEATCLERCKDRGETVVEPCERDCQAQLDALHKVSSE